MKYAIVIMLSFLFIGCADYTNASNCYRQGYKGVVADNRLYCSNGELTPNGEEYITSVGVVSKYEFNSKIQKAFYFKFDTPNDLKRH